MDPERLWFRLDLELLGYLLDLEVLEVRDCLRFLVVQGFRRCQGLH